MYVCNCAYNDSRLSSLYNGCCFLRSLIQPMLVQWFPRARRSAALLIQKLKNCAVAVEMATLNSVHFQCAHAARELVEFVAIFFRGSGCFSVMMDLATSSSERISGTTEDCSLGQSDFVDGSALNPANSSDVGHASLLDSDRETCHVGEKEV